MTMNRYFECPRVAEPALKGTHTSMFLAGGITNCPDWQAGAKDAVLDQTDLLVFNPRRATFDTSDPSATKVQIHWEHYHLKFADIRLFWFPKETLCPITLFEYGKWLKHPVVVGTHPDYERREDVIVQTALERSDVVIRDNLDDVLEDLFRLAPTLRRAA